MQTPAQVDPIKFEVIRNALVEVTEEMAIALRRSAYSTNIKTRADFSCVFFDRQLRPVAQAFAQPVHLGSLSRSVPAVIQAYGPENLGPGDTLVTNDPYLRGVHLNDITLISPDGERTHRVQADCDADLWSMAERLQCHLDGVRGTNSMIHDYLRELERFAD